MTMSGWRDMLQGSIEEAAKRADALVQARRAREMECFDFRQWVQSHSLQNFTSPRDGEAQEDPLPEEATEILSTIIGTRRIRIPPA